MTFYYALVRGENEERHAKMLNNIQSLEQFRTMSFNVCIHNNELDRQTTKKHDSTPMLLLALAQQHENKETQGFIISLMLCAEYIFKPRPHSKWFPLHVHSCHCSSRSVSNCQSVHKKQQCCTTEENRNEPCPIIPNKFILPSCLSTLTLSILLSSFVFR